MPESRRTVLSAAHKRLDDFRQQGRVQAGSLIISVFGDAILPRGSRIWLGSLIRLLKPLELNERLVRTAVFRLAKEEWLRTEPYGRRTDYLLTPSGQRRFEEASRHIYASSAPLWDRRWRLIVTVGELTPKEREALRSALFWQGFGTLGGDCYVHPSADLSAAFDALSVSHQILTKPCDPAALREHRCITYPYGTERPFWDVDGMRLRVDGPFRSNSSEAVHRAVRSGLGIALLPVIQVRADLDNGVLQPVLPNAEVAPVEIVMAHRFSGVRLPSAVRVVRDFLTDAFPGEDMSQSPPYHS